MNRLFVYITGKDTRLTGFSWGKRRGTFPCFHCV